MNDIVAVLFAELCCQHPRQCRVFHLDNWRPGGGGGGGLLRTQLSLPDFLLYGGPRIHLWRARAGHRESVLVSSTNTRLHKHTTWRSPRTSTQTCNAAHAYRKNAVHIRQFHIVPHRHTQSHVCPYIRSVTHCTCYPALMCRRSVRMQTSSSAYQPREIDVRICWKRGTTRCNIRRSRKLLCGSVAEVFGEVGQSQNLILDLLCCRKSIPGQLSNNSSNLH